MCKQNYYGIGKSTLFATCVSRNANNLKAVFDVDFTDGLTLIEVAEGVTVDEVKAKTEAPFQVAADLKTMQQA